MLAGDLTEFTLQDIFQLLGLTRKTGALRISHDGGEGQVLVHEGRVCFAVADASRLPMAARLVAAGLIDARGLGEVVRQHRADGPAALAAALLATDEVAGPEADEAVREQVTDALFTLLQTESGTFEFDHRARLAHEWPREPVAGDELLDEARQRLERWRDLRERVPGPQARIALAPSPPGTSVVEVGREAWRLLVLVDGRRTVEQIASLSGAGAYAVAEQLAELVDAGLVEAVGEGERSSLDELLESRRSLDRLTRLDGDGAQAERASAGAGERRTSSQRADGGGDSSARGVVLGGVADDAPVDPEEASRRAIADARAAALRGAGPTADVHPQPEDAAAEASETAGEAPEDEAPEEEAPEDEASVEEPAEEDPAEEDPAQDELAEEDSAEEDPADENPVAEDPVAEESAAQGANADRSGGGARGPRKAGRLDRAQVARELASLGLDDGGGGARSSRTRSRASAETGGAEAASTGAGSAGTGSGRAGSGRAGQPVDAPPASTGSAATAEPLPEPEEPPEGQEAADDGQPLRRDEGVNRGLLLRLIDGVQDA